ncbi:MULTISPECIES: ABC transporter permease [Shinella]|uniref:ABC transporter permease n=2 Tax=Shinella TaxID=323620 RepID=A0AA50CJ80_9HYPH|nr:MULTISPECIES: ABC transporter permease [Shinella]MDP9592176.1 simple sugar transport system permease protein [Shinella zoogloeoides]UPA24543.1 ABC transporter permease [Shinella oryzae]WLR96892.1 ABC transporter permease [Shinella sumterensis]WLS03893.1 ABC transporter permease [Shinella oryzae]
MDVFQVFIELAQSTVRLSTPLILAALAGLFTERAGIFDIGLEGKMLGAAFAAGCVAYISQSVYMGLLAAVLVSVLLSLVHGYASITQRGSQIVSGVAINFVVAGSTVILGEAWFRQGGRTPALSADGRFGTVTLPFADAVRDVPILGPLYSGLLSGHSPLTYLAFLMVPASWWILYRTRFGLRLRAVGENPGAVDTAGISVIWLRYRAVICCGILCGIAGAYLSLAAGAGFTKGMTAGKGYIALAALIFAKWRPKNILFACLLFGFLDAFAIRYQGYAFPLIGKVPVQLMQALPYILTVILLAGFIGKAIPPKAGGVPYVKER